MAAFTGTQAFSQNQMTKQESQLVQQEAINLWFASPGVQKIEGVIRDDFYLASGKAQQHYRKLAREKLNIK
ncbi:hypothetical protein [Hymenobacter pini]|uniref:hypothetical protein n=1 Tax=Hymenobacter pini TaxID=2880879 RepID=UPI001CF10AAC|nr:hypothetical protein [Hymenobacter pini]MCA8830547.1 hypothetical protein [Hymenobacter pini]